MSRLERDYRKGLYFIAIGSLALAASYVVVWVFLLEMLGLLMEYFMALIRLLTTPGQVTPAQLGTPVPLTSEHVDAFTGVLCTLWFAGYMLIYLGVDSLGKTTKGGLQGAFLVSLLPIAPILVLLGYILMRVVTRIEIAGREYTGFIIGLQLVVVGMLILIVGLVGLILVLVKLAQVHGNNAYLITALILALSLGGAWQTAIVGYICLAYIALRTAREITQVS